MLPGEINFSTLDIPLIRYIVPVQAVLQAGTGDRTGRSLTGIIESTASTDAGLIRLADESVVLGTGAVTRFR